MKYAFIRDELAGACTVRMACRLLEVSPSGYYRFLKAPVAARKVRRLAVEDAVVRIHAESRRIYGAPKIAHALPRLGVSAHRNTGSRIMQEHGIRAKSARKWRPTTTQRGHGHGASPDMRELLLEVVCVGILDVSARPSCGALPISASISNARARCSARSSSGDTSRTRSDAATVRDRSDRIYTVLSKTSPMVSTRCATPAGTQRQRRGGTTHRVDAASTASTPRAA